MLLPGQGMDVDVDYTPPRSSGDDRRRVGVEFAEPAAPFIWLELFAHIREPISIFPAEVQLMPLCRTPPPQSSLTVENCTGHDVKILAVRASVPWLRVGPVLADKDACRPGSPRQVWHLTLAADTAGLAPGSHQAEVEIQTDDPEDPLKQVPVSLWLRAPVEAMPARIAFGDVAPGTPASSRFLVHLLPDFDLDALGEVALSHDLGDQFRLSCSRSPGDQWLITAVLTPPAEAAETVLQGNLFVRFTNKEFLPLQIPVSARIRRP